MLGIKQHQHEEGKARESRFWGEGDGEFYIHWIILGLQIDVGLKLAAKALTTLASGFREPISYRASAGYDVDGR